MQTTYSENTIPTADVVPVPQFIQDILAGSDRTITGYAPCQESDPLEADSILRYHRILHEILESRESAIFQSVTWLLELADQMLTVHRSHLELKKFIGADPERWQAIPRVGGK